MPVTRPHVDHELDHIPHREPQRTTSRPASRITRKAPGSPFYFRRRDPRDPRREVSLSLGVRGYRHALFLAEALDAWVSRLLTREPSMTVTELRRLLRAHLSELLNEDMTRRVRTPPNAAVYAPWFPGHPDHQTGAHADLEALDWELTHRREDLQTRDYAAVTEEAEALAERFSVPHDLRDLLHHGLLEVFVRLTETLKARTLGDAGTVLVEEQGATAAVAQDQEGGGTPPAKRLSEVAAAHEAWMQARGVGVFSLRKSRTSLALFQDVCGDKDLGLYTRQDLTLCCPAILMSGQRQL